MGRKRTELGPVVEAEIAQRMQRGESAETIAAAIGGGVSARTVLRRMREIRGPVGKGLYVPPLRTPAPEGDDAPTEPEDVPDAIDAATAARWIASVEKNAKAAEREGNIGAFTSLMRVLATLLEHKRKATPMPKPDPNDNPDMIAAKEKARAEFHRLIEHKLLGSYVRGR